MINVLIVEDSLVVREFLVYLLSSDPEICVIGTASNGEDALDAVKQRKPDVITMDITMPKMNGFEATRRIMETHPTPIIIVSGAWDPKEVETTFRAVEAGALAVLSRPVGLGHPDHEAMARDLIQTVKLMSEVKVVRRWAHLRRNEAAPVVPPSTSVPLLCPSSDIKLVAIGASTGGPIALHAILSRLPREFPLPVLIVQHIAAGFTQGLVEWLAQSSGFPVHIATHGEDPLPGHAYVAPDGSHMGVGRGGRIILSRDEPENGVCPSVSYLFRSVAYICGECAVGVLLTGMGKDGAEELKMMKDRGALTIAQDRETSVVYGMPGEAANLGAASYLLPPEKIAEILTDLVKKG
jgi:two-component system chemotaxis response regulator CheB